MTKLIETTTVVSHPLEHTFDIIPRTTEQVVVTAVPDPSAEHVEYDEKDQEIESNFDTIYMMALSTAQDMEAQATTIEGKYRPRMYEVAATMLTVALNASSQKLAQKVNKDKHATSSKAAGAPGTVNNNLIVTDRNQLLRMLRPDTGTDE